MAYMDLGPIATVVKSATPPPPQAQPSVAEAMKPVPETEIQAPVPPPAKGAHPGLGEHLDLYDTEKPPVPAHPAERQAHQVTPDDAPTREVQAQILAAEAEAEAQEEEDKVASEAQLLGKDTGLPQPSVKPVHPDIPFLKPLGRSAPLGQAIDERV